MNKKNFINISMNGRLAYQLMCAEKYFVNKYPNKDFTELFHILWKVTNGMYWDTFSGYLIELKKEYFFKVSSYDDRNWLYLTKKQYDLFKPMVSEFDDEDEALLLTLIDQAEVYAYTVVPKDTSESIDIVFETIEFLKKRKIKLPDIKLIEIYTIDQMDGWGDFFDGTKLSIILKNR